MSKHTLWICDHCRKEKVEVELNLPKNWVTAKVSIPEIKDGHNEFIWCDFCWRSFKEVLPLKRAS